MADQKNPNNTNNQNAPNKANLPQTEQQKQANEAKLNDAPPGSQDKQPSAPGSDTDKK